MEKIVVQASLYEITADADDPKRLGFAFVDELSPLGNSSIATDFMPTDVPANGRQWTAPKLADVWSSPEVLGNVNPHIDYPCVDLIIPAFSLRGVDALRDMLEPNGELLPLTTEVGDYFAFNTTTVVDVLDHSHSEITWFSARQDLAVHIDKYVCHVDRLASLSIFRIVEKPASVFVTQQFVQRVRDHQLRGFRFVLCFSSY